jgi:tetratricopeptide (TPR) repeat protein
VLQYSDRFDEALALNAEILAHARQRGHREQLAFQLTGGLPVLFALGRWDEAIARADEVEQVPASPHATSEVIEAVAILCEQGRLDKAEALLADNEWQRDAEEAEIAANFAAVAARLHRARNRPAEALAVAERGLQWRTQLSVVNTYMKQCQIEALEATFELDDLARAEELLTALDALQMGLRTAGMEAQRARFHARLDARRGAHDAVDSGYRKAETLFEQHGLAFYLAVTRLEHAEWLVEQGRTDEAASLLTQAVETFERLEATPWLDRVAAVRTSAPTEITA